jgi:hypothetical protein
LCQPPTFCVATRLWPRSKNRPKPKNSSRGKRCALDGYLENQFKRLTQVERIVETGDPAWVITAYAKIEKTDLTMMPTHGYGPFSAAAGRLGHRKSVA